jgi:uncharacterized protein (UPF0332 family)
MRLQQWKTNGWLQAHQTTPAQIADLLAIVDRDLEDSMRDLSPDWQFGIAYNAALKLCTILLFASGYRPEKNLAHYRTLAALPLILGDERKDDADYLDTCRAKRNTAEYDAAGTVSQSEADELREFAKELRSDVTAWLKANHPALVPAR